MSNENPWKNQSNPQKQNDLLDSEREDDKLSESDRVELAAEYDRDGGVILGIISDALKEKDYETALDYIEKYSPVARDDKQFKALADLAEEQIQIQDKVVILETKLNATPDLDIKKRMKLLKQILDITTDDEKYRERLNTYLSLKMRMDAANDEVAGETGEIAALRAQAALHKDSSNDPIIGLDDDTKSRPIVPVQALLSMPWFAIMFVAFLVTGMERHEIPRFLLSFVSLIAVVFHLNVKVNPFNRFSAGARIGMAWVVWLFAGIVIYCVLYNDEGTKPNPVPEPAAVEVPADPGVETEPAY